MKVIIIFLVMVIVLSGCETQNSEIIRQYLALNTYVNGFKDITMLYNFDTLWTDIKERSWNVVRVKSKYVNSNILSNVLVSNCSQMIKAYKTSFNDNNCWTLLLCL